MHQRTVSLPVAAFRCARLICHLAYGILLSIFYPHCSLSYRQRILRRWSTELLDVLNVKLERRGLPTPPSIQTTMLVSNHISWLDVFVINAITPACFVAKAEVNGWPLLGLLCRRTRTIFIERDIRRDTVRSNGLISAMLDEGECVALFPEGTSTDGTGLRHFHSSLFQSAIDSDATLIPGTIHYHDGQGNRCDDAAFIGDMTFVESMKKILFSRSLHASLTLLPAVQLTGKNRRTAATEAHSAIETTLHTPLPIPAASHPGNGIDKAARSVHAHSSYSLLLNSIFRPNKTP